MDSVPQSKSPTTLNSHINEETRVFGTSKWMLNPFEVTSKGFSIQFSQKGERVNIVKYSKYLSIHSPQGFSGIIYNTGWGTLPDCLRCSLLVMKEWVMMPPYMSVKENKHWTKTGEKRNLVCLILLHSPGLAHHNNIANWSRVSGSKGYVFFACRISGGLKEGSWSRIPVPWVPEDIFSYWYW